MAFTLSSLKSLHTRQFQHRPSSKLHPLSPTSSSCLTHSTLAPCPLQGKSCRPVLAMRPKSIQDNQQATAAAAAAAANAINSSNSNEVEADHLKVSPTRSAVLAVSSHAVSAQDIFDASKTNMPAAENGQGEKAHLRLTCSLLVGFSGRWERWQPPVAGPAAAKPPTVNSNPTATPPADPAPASGSTAAVAWQLVSSGQSMYAFQPGAPPGQNTATAITVQVMEAPDVMPKPMECFFAPAASSAGSAAYNELQRDDGGEGWCDVMRSTNQFTVQDVFFKPHLPDSNQPPGAASPAAGLRLWAANQHGFAMAPTHLPQQLLQHHQQQGSGNMMTAPGAADDGPSSTSQMPFIANLYVKHPSLEPGIGRRWGWNVQYDPKPGQRGTLQHIHHTSLGLTVLPAEALEDALRPGGSRTQPPVTPESSGLRLPPSSIDAFMAQPGCQALSSSAVEFTYDSSGQLQRKDISRCTWSSPWSSSSDSRVYCLRQNPSHNSTPAPAGAVNNNASSALTDSESGQMPDGLPSSVRFECWYSSGSYTRVPADLQSCLAAGKSVVIEAGAIIPWSGPTADALAGSGSSGSTADTVGGAVDANSGAGGDVGFWGVTRWLLSYRPSDGQLDFARIEVYKR